MKERHRQYLPCLMLSLTILFIVFVRANFLEIPLERDEGEYYYLAQLILDGKTPYIDFQLRKPPILFYTYAFINLIFGNTLSGMQSGFIFINILTVIFIYFTCKNIINAFTGIVVSASYALLSISPYISGFSTQAEHIIVFYTSVGLLFLVNAFKSDKPLYYYFSGFFICMAFLVKQNAVFFIMFGCIAIIVYFYLKKQKKFKAIFGPLLYYSAGIFSIFSIVVLVIHLQGALDEMYYWTLVAASKYVSRITFFIGVENFVTNLNNIVDKYLFFWLFAGFGLLTLYFSGISKYLKILIYIFFILSFLTIVPGYKFFGHYWIQLLLAISLLIGIFFNTIKDFFSKYMRLNYAISLSFAVFFLLFLQNVVKNHSYYFNPDHIEIMRNVYGSNPFPESKVIGEYIKKHSDENDRIAVLGSEPQVYFYSNRRCPSRYHFIEYMMKDIEKFPLSKMYQHEFIKDIIKSKPRYLVYFHHHWSWSRSENSDYTIFRWFNKFSKKHYIPIGIADMISRDNINYVWHDDLKTYKRKGSYFIVVYERKDL